MNYTRKRNEIQYEKGLPYFFKKTLYFYFEKCYYNFVLRQNEGVLIF